MLFIVCKTTIASVYENNIIVIDVANGNPINNEKKPTNKQILFYVGGDVETRNNNISSEYVILFPSWRNFFFSILIIRFRYQ